MKAEFDSSQGKDNRINIELKNITNQLEIVNKEKKNIEREYYLLKTQLNENRKLYQSEHEEKLKLEGTLKQDKIKLQNKESFNDTSKKELKTR